jgi:ABC-type multidrug transport system fused ATPase/permease subunit
MKLIKNLQALLFIIIEEKYRKLQIIILFTLILISSFFELFSIGVFLPFLGALTSPEKILYYYNNTFISKYFIFNNSRDLILPISILFITAVLLNGIFRVVLLWYQTKLSFSIGAELSNKVYSRTLYQPYKVHILQNSSDIISAITNKVAGVIFNILVPIPTLIASIVILIFILSTLIYINPIVAIGSFSCFTIIYLIIIFITKKKIVEAGFITNRENTNVIKTLQEGLGGIRDVLIDGSQETFIKIYKNADLQLRKSQAKITFISSSPRYIIEMFVLIIMSIFAFKISSNGSSSPIPLLGTLALGAQRVLPILQQIYVSYTNIKGGEASLLDVLFLLNQTTTINKFTQVNKLSFKKNIIFDKVSFSYNNKNLVLSNISFEIKKGEKIGIFGKTGGGKSTLLDILMGLLEPSQGVIKVDDVLINAENISLWQNHISHVPQNIFLSDSSIAENIAFGIPLNQINFEQLKIAATKAQLIDTINALPEGFLTKVGERGVRLSGGQRQRIGIARALYKNSNIIIFDEATSALDNKTEKEIMEEIYNLDKDLTIFIIAHRLSTLKECDKFIEVKNLNLYIHNNFEDII